LQEAACFGYNGEWNNPVPFTIHQRNPSMPEDTPAESDLSALILMLVHDKFPLGQLMATSNALVQLEQSDIQTALLHHARGDWGELDQEDKAANDNALIDGTRLLSSYRSKRGIKFWIITEADRSITTVLLPEDY